MLAACGSDSSRGAFDPERLVPPRAGVAELWSSSPSIAISPKTVAVFTSATQRFHAKVVGLPSAGVDWSVEEAGGCGSITKTGEYEAPAAAGTSHVVATSAATPRSRDVATVVVSEVSVGGMPHVSVGKPAFASEGDASLLTDGAYRSPHAWTFTPSRCRPSTPCWAAVHVGAGPSKLLVEYFDGGDVRPNAAGCAVWNQTFADAVSESYR